MSIYCIECNKETTNTKFCSHSCRAAHYNINNRRHGNPASECLHCGSKTKKSTNKYCSSKCFGLSKKMTEFERKRKQRFYSMTYYMRRRNQTPEDADMELIKEIYINCPDGYEVDHIIPVSKGGLHHQNNLQYLTSLDNKRKSNKII